MKNRCLIMMQLSLLMLKVLCSHLIYDVFISRSYCCHTVQLKLIVLRYRLNSFGILLLWAVDLEFAARESLRPNIESSANADTC